MNLPQSDFNKIVKTLYDAEGGMTRDPSDSASKRPMPGVFAGQTGWHTNKGVTWANFVDLAPKLGYKATPQLFVTMPDTLWMKIFVENYWKILGGDLSKHFFPALLAAHIMYLSYINNTTKIMFKSARQHGYNGPANTKSIFLWLNQQPFNIVSNFSLSFYRDILENLSRKPTAQFHFKGWKNRFDKLYNIGLEDLKKKVRAFIQLSASPRLRLW